MRVCYLNYDISLILVLVMKIDGVGSRLWDGLGGIGNFKGGGRRI